MVIRNVAICSVIFLHNDVIITYLAISLSKRVILIIHVQASSDNYEESHEHGLTVN